LFYVINNDIELVYHIVKSINKSSTLLWMEPEPYHIDLRDLRKLAKTVI